MGLLGCLFEWEMMMRDMTLMDGLLHMTNQEVSNAKYHGDLQGSLTRSKANTNSIFMSNTLLCFTNSPIKIGPILFEIDGIR
ncbi:hypothetical protein IEQ34_026469 [Dendrobium chrysotoxum]|uniref:Uncharacterized protein n=1 Tax=Dendrobium chrysotoxum TaxID=161865 RepID=A0AAV7FMF3_DENCH|nr:hypothetical protein IEQ34_026469 [Dendrobium chrysotoxum]